MVKRVGQVENAKDGGPATAAAAISSGNPVTAAAILGGHHEAFAEFHEEYIRHYIGLADSKAGIILGLALALFSNLIEKDIVQKAFTHPAASFFNVYAMLCLAFLLASALCAFLVVAPRRAAGGESLIFFGEVAKFASADRYLASLAKLKSSDLLDARIRHCYDISVICARKYTLLSRATWLGIIGLILTIIMLPQV